jgi:Got1/Sft2-like family
MCCCSRSWSKARATDRLTVSPPLPLPVRHYQSFLGVTCHGNVFIPFINRSCVAKQTDQNCLVLVYCASFTMISNEAGRSGNNVSSNSDYGFDYRSLLPTTTSSSSSMRLMGDSESASNEEDDCCSGAAGSYFPALTWRERCIGCVTCVIAGYLLSLGSLWRLKDLALGRPLPFVLNATTGNIISLAGSFFFSGPRAQVRRMFHDKRRTATLLYLGSLFVTLIVAFVAPRRLPLKSLLLLLLMGAQYLAVAWYCLSYVPFAHDAVSSYLSHVWSRYTSNDY